MLTAELEFQIPAKSAPFYVGKSYKIEKIIGKGSFGSVFTVKKGNLTYALKILHRLPKFYQLGLQEVAILKKISHPCIVKCVHHFVHDGHLCILLELLYKSVYEILQSRKFKGFNLNVVATIAQQLLSALDYLRGKRIIHSDIKPENVVFVQEYSTQVKLIDFGSACIQPKYNYIQSRYYRSPEVLMGYSVGTEMDMYSLGVMLPELYTGMPLIPGVCEHSQLLMITKILGKPPQYIFEASPSERVSKFFDCHYNPIPCSTNKGLVHGCKSYKSTKDVQNILGQLLNLPMDCDFVVFLSTCITWDPIQGRISPNKALLTKFISRPKIGILL
eukprot:NODE_869_length_3566_cov_0.357658.p1 type:complete len:331 gc:universal NODE_869_length_3566_cov_0.357658:435-1427(+)